MPTIAKYLSAIVGILFIVLIAFVYYFATKEEDFPPKPKTSHLEDLQVKALTRAEQELDKLISQ
jgi:phosphotransferase system  glucose/maltose/N-acetylglucosamine-specific IIC component